MAQHKEKQIFTLLSAKDSTTFHHTLIAGFFFKATLMMTNLSQIIFNL